MQGWRDKMEDSHICELNVIENVHVFGVFDGHGGPEVSSFVRKNFIKTLKAMDSF